MRRDAAMNRREFATLAAAMAAGALSPRTLVGASQVDVNGERLNRRLAELSRFGANPSGGVTRLAYTDANRDALAAVTQWMREAKLEPTIDYAGNLIGRRAGRDRARQPIVFGSHIDSVPEGGNYDGNVGSMAALEAAQTLTERGVTLRHPIEVAIWSNEEGGLYGSRAVSGQLEPNELDQPSRSGKTIRDGITFLGGDPARLTEVRRKRGDITAYLEMHIEQGGILHATGTNIGIVEGIVGIRHWDVTVTGFANHAGTTPMDQRRDALLAAARFVDAVNRIVRSVPGRQVGTVGRIQAWPGAPNVVPGRVACSLELRDLDEQKIVMLFNRIQEETRRIASETGTSFEFDATLRNVPAICDTRIRTIIGDVARERRLSTRLMPSGAGHDAQSMAILGPVGMIFVPSVDGISHSPRELSRPEDITDGANVLLDVVRRIDSWS
jgi:beta-ureidopropionase / N-carbamoyl-L-amino-acid hydrolase